MLARSGRIASCLLLGIAVGAVGTVMHRSTPPWGLALGLAVVLAAGVFARAWEGWSGSLAFAAGWVGTVLALWQVGPGGDILVPALGGWGNVWILGGVVALGLPLMAPSRWFED
ncbi:MAG: hypothetical protein GX593_13540 [Actinomycetales bacterium]|nr:hypothetical protein [Actinomycetales bacterium]